MIGIDRRKPTFKSKSFKNFANSFSLSISLLLYLFFITILLAPGTSLANGNRKDILKRISIANRGNKRGYVVRFAMTSPADSFIVMQPSANLIQLAIFKSGIDYKHVQIDKNYSTFKKIAIKKIPTGIGINIYLKRRTYLIANAYPDRNKHDLLLGLTTASKKDLAILTEGIQKIDWGTLGAGTDVASQSSDKDLANLAGTNSTGNTLKKKIKFDVVVIDPGHGGKDPGTIGYHHIEEKNIALKVALKVGKDIREHMPGIKVVFTRHTDKFIPLKDRGHIANRAKGDLFISIHCNSSPDHYAHGTEVYFLGLSHSKEAFEVMKKENQVVKLENKNNSPDLSEEQMLIYELANNGNMASSEKFAEILNHEFKYYAHRHVRGIHQAGFIVLYYASMPAVLIELGFLSNPKEARFLDSNRGQNILASAIYRSVKKYKEDFDKSQNFKSK